jgi:hypothetical protein
LAPTVDEGEAAVDGATSGVTRSSASNRAGASTRRSQSIQPRGTVSRSAWN